MSHSQITDDMLHAYVDGQLDAEDVAVVKAYLQDHPERAAEIADWLAQNQALQDLFPKFEGELEVPDIALPRSANQNFAPMKSIAAALLMLVIGLSVGWIGRGGHQPGNTQIAVAGLVEQAIAAHAVYAADQNRPVELDTSQEALLIRWLSNRVGENLVAPDLSANGFTLMGGRLLSVSQGPAAQFMYENSAGERITLFAARSDNSQMAQFQYKQNGNIGSFYWQDENIRYAVVGGLPRKELSKVANTVYKAFL